MTLGVMIEYCKEMGLSKLSEVGWWVNIVWMDGSFVLRVGYFV